jgi:hypothetical protein
MSKTVWVRTARIEEEDYSPTDPLSGYPQNYDYKNPNKRYFTRSIVSRSFCKKEDAEKPLKNEVAFVSLVEVPNE